eukprot:3236642-Alexandrium_andersonii.AAC.1
MEIRRWGGEHDKVPAHHVVGLELGVEYFQLGAKEGREQDRQQEHAVDKGQVRLHALAEEDVAPGMGHFQPIAEEEHVQDRLQEHGDQAVEDEHDEAPAYSVAELEARDVDCVHQHAPTTAGVEHFQQPEGGLAEAADAGGAAYDHARLHGAPKAGGGGDPTWAGGKPAPGYPRPDGPVSACAGTCAVQSCNPEEEVGEEVALAEEEPPMR